MSRSNQNLESNVNYKDLKNAIEEDKLYWIRNEAKIRASVTAQNYDEFREIVAAAHLNPLNKGDKTRKANIGWNKCAPAKPRDK